jgi:hypothetical protein
MTLYAPVHSVLKTTPGPICLAVGQGAQVGYFSGGTSCWVLATKVTSCSSQLRAVMVS